MADYFYRLFMSKDGPCVIEMQSFDESDYDLDRIMLWAKFSEPSLAWQAYYDLMSGRKRTTDFDSDTIYEE